MSQRESALATTASFAPKVYTMDDVAQRRGPGLEEVRTLPALLSWRIAATPLAEAYLISTTAPGAGSPMAGSRSGSSSSAGAGLSWQAAKARQAELAHIFAATNGRRARGPRKAINSARRHAFLLSGLLVCGSCRGKYGVITKQRYGCLNHHRRVSCSNGSPCPTLQNRTAAPFADLILVSRRLTAAQPAAGPSRLAMNVSVSDRRFKGRTSPRSCSGVHRLKGYEDRSA